MKHEIEITDEMLARFEKAQHQLKRAKTLSKADATFLLVTALNGPKRRFTDSQREDRRCGEKHIEGNQGVAWVEAPHGAEEIAPGVFLFSSDASPHGITSTQIGYNDHTAHIRPGDDVYRQHSRKDDHK